MARGCRKAGKGKKASNQDGDKRRSPAVRKMLRMDVKSKPIAKVTKRNAKNKLKTNKKMREKRKHITEDIILHKLLPLLPAKSLFRFKSVCRRWASFISGGTNFAWDQCRSYASPAGLFYMHDAGRRKRGLIPVSPNSVGAPDPTLGFAGKRVTVLASSNGLLLCCRGEASPHFFVCNPATKEWTTVKRPTYFPAKVGFGFDPSDSCVGFTIVWVTLRHLPSDDGDPVSREGECSFRVYNSRTGWRKPDETAVVPRKRWHDSSLFAARRIHWHVNDTVLSFDPYTDVSRVTPLPAQGEFSGARHYWRLGEMRGGLSCVNVVDRAELQVWLMDEVNWEKVYCVPLAKIFKTNLEILESCGGEEEKKMMTRGEGEEGAKRNGKVVKSRIRCLVQTCPIKPLPSLGDDILFLWMRRRVFSYDLLTMRLTELYLSETRSKCHFFPYLNNLAPLGEISDEHPLPQDINTDKFQNLFDE